MRTFAALAVVASTLVAGLLPACSSSSNDPGFGGGGPGSSSSSGGGSSSGGSSGGSSGSSSGGNNNPDGGGFNLDGGGNPSDAPTDVIITVSTTVYAHTDDTLYKVDPMTNAVTSIGTFTGLNPTTDGGAPPVTDLAVDGAGDVYVNTESDVYKATVPSSPGPVSVTHVATIGATGVYFYALAFAPAGAIDPNNEVLIGGDNKGNLWSIDTGTGAAVNLGGFGKDPFGGDGGSNIFELSGDLVFYLDNNNAPTGLATIRSCPSGGSSSKCGNDYLAGVDMTKLAAAYKAKTPAATLLGGVYGSTVTNGMVTALGNGTGFHDVFGLGAWNSKVFGFTRYYKSTSQMPTMITIDTTSGAGTPVGSPFSFQNGWSGAGVTSKVTITVPPPPPPPPQAQ